MAQIRELLEKLDPAERALLKQASHELSLRYRTGSYEEKPLSKFERYAYLLTRLPATLAASAEVFLELKDRALGFSPSSLVDIGSGPGTASWAAQDLWPSIKEVQLLEKDQEWIKLGQQLAKSHSLIGQGKWIEHNLMHNLPIEAADLLVASYAFQELPLNRLLALVPELFLKTRQALVIIEPGTPQGFQKIQMLRDSLIKQGAKILAPCPHELSCPMQGSDWCHFSTRLARDKIHRQLKDASLPYEDEKYAYLIAARDIIAVKDYAARVIRSPIKRSGHIILDLCTKIGLERQVIARSQKANFLEAKKSSWGQARENSF